MPRPLELATQLPSDRCATHPVLGTTGAAGNNAIMQRLTVTLDTPEANLALDEALLDWLEDEHPDREVLRIWESPEPVVIVGRSSRVDLEVDEAACADRGVPILRRPSGGAPVVIGPGCLMYSVTLSYALRPQLRAIDRAHTLVLDRHVEFMRPHLPNIRRAGTSDLAILTKSEPRADDPGATTTPSKEANHWMKISGNSLRCKRNHVLYHGTFLYAFEIALIARYLQTPLRQPEYREQRSHEDFVTNVPLRKETLEQVLIAAWQADDELTSWPRTRVEQYANAKYATSSSGRHV